MDHEWFIYDLNEFIKIYARSYKKIISTISNQVDQHYFDVIDISSNKIHIGVPT